MQLEFYKRAYLELLELCSSRMYKDQELDDDAKVFKSMETAEGTRLSTMEEIIRYVHGKYSLYKMGDGSQKWKCVILLSFHKAN